jgi:hypothetical protein
VNDVLVFAEVLVQDYLHLDLLRREATLFECMFFVYELDRDDGLRLIVGHSFAYAVKSQSVYLFQAGGIELTMHRRPALLSY